MVPFGDFLGRPDFLGMMFQAILATRSIAKLLGVLFPWILERQDKHIQFRRPKETTTSISVGHNHGPEPSFDNDDCGPQFDRPSQSGTQIIPHGLLKACSS